MDTATVSLLVSALALAVSLGGVLLARRSTVAAERSERHAKRSADAAHRTAAAEEAALAIERERAIAERSERKHRGAPDWRVLDVSVDNALGLSVRLLNRGGTASLDSARLEGDLWFAYCDRLVAGRWVELNDDENVPVGHLGEATIGVTDKRIVRHFQGGPRSTLALWAHTPEGAYRIHYVFPLRRDGGPYGGFSWRPGEPKVRLD